MQSRGKRHISTDGQFDKYFSNAKLEVKTFPRDASIDDTVKLVIAIIKKYSFQVDKLSRILRGKNLQETSRKIFDFVYKNIQYTPDKEGVEQLHTPSRIWHKRFYGVDCDDYSIFIGCVLKCLNIPFALRITKYNGKKNFQHIYVIVPKNGKVIIKDNNLQGDYFIIDPVLDEFNSEKLFSEHKDYSMNTNLSGIPLEFLSGIANPTNKYHDKELMEVVFGVDLEGIDDEGVGSIGDKMLQIKKYLQKTIKLIKKYPELIAPQGDVKTILSLYESALVLGAIVNDWIMDNEEQQEAEPQQPQAQPQPQQTAGVDENETIEGDYEVVK